MTWSGGGSGWTRSRKPGRGDPSSGCGASAAWARRRSRQSLDRVRYFDCELPSVRRRIESAESFLRHNRQAAHRARRGPSAAEPLRGPEDRRRPLPARRGSWRRARRRSGPRLASATRSAGRKTDMFLPPMTVIDLDAFDRPDLRAPDAARGGCPRSSSADASPRRTSRSGWTPTGRRTSWSCSASRDGRRSSSSSSSS